LNCTIDSSLGADLTYAFPDAFNSVDPGKMDTWRFGDIAGYLNVELKPVEQLRLIPGIRHDYYPEPNYPGALLPAF
jgi:hypothetical protein